MTEANHPLGKAEPKTGIEAKTLVEKAIVDLEKHGEVKYHTPICATALLMPNQVEKILEGLVAENKKLQFRLARITKKALAYEERMVEKVEILRIENKVLEGRLSAIQQVDGVACKLETGEYCCDYKPNDTSSCSYCDVAILRKELGVLLSPSKEVVGSDKK